MDGVVVVRCLRMLMEKSWKQMDLSALSMKTEIQSVSELLKRKNKRNMAFTQILNCS